MHRAEDTIVVTMQPGEEILSAGVTADEQHENEMIRRRTPLCVRLEYYTRGAWLHPMAVLRPNRSAQPD